MQHLGRTLAIVNPAAQNGNGARGAAFLRYAAGESDAPFSSLDIATTRAARHAESLAREAAGYESVVVIGGDGTAHEAAIGLMGIPREARPRFALLPCGNGNDYARTLGLGLSIEEAYAGLKTAQARPLDVGRCNGEPFLETVSFGLDAAIALGTRTRRERTKHEGTRLFVEEGVNQLLFHRDVYGYDARPFLDGPPQEPIVGDMHLFAVQIGPTYGGGFRVCPQADPADGLFDCCIARAPLGFAAAALLFARAKDGHHTGRTDVFAFFRAEGLTVEFSAEPPAQIDGEPASGVRFDLRVEHGALDVYCAPAAQGASRAGRGSRS